MGLLEDKYEQLGEKLLEYGRVGVAFSGGVDSSLLLYCCLTTLGAGNVLPLHGRSCLQTRAEQDRVTTWLAAHGFDAGIELLVFDLQPLRWQGFAANSEERCYVCKQALYRIFLEKLVREDIAVLLDGTNLDDLKDSRPGLRAIHELGVRMPLVEAGLDKTDVRQLSRQLGLETWNQPSASCLATRIPHGLRITPERLRQIERWEQVLADMGFSGCRVCPDQEWRQVVIRLEEDQLARMADRAVRQAIVQYFSNEIGPVYMDLEGRPVTTAI